LFASTLADSGLFSLLLRAGLALLLAFATGVFFGGPLVRGLRRLRVRDDNEKGDSAELDALHASKKNTPTMGGVLIVSGFLVGTLGFADLGTFAVIATILTVLLLAGVGACDDIVKLRTSGQGFTRKGKLAVLCVAGLALGMSLYAAYSGEANVALAEGALSDTAAAIAEGAALERTPHAARIDVASVEVPLTGGLTLSLGLAFILFAALVLVATTNAVNFTDGLDGLAGGTGSLTLLTYTVVAAIAGHEPLAAALSVVHVPAAREACVLGAALLGGTLGFLWHNGYPARLFMGDTGSLALGGGIACLALLCKQELLLLVAGGVFVFEGLSVALQIGYFKLTGGKRLFKIAPIHHHYQFLGLTETHVTLRFWIVGALLAGLSLFAYLGG
jgi:phospho-N-acetylmuramoyl-pentapeptide-transferase